MGQENSLIYIYGMMGWKLVVLGLLFCVKIIAAEPSSLIAYSMTVSLKENPLPISISSLVLHSNITKISLKMGHLTATMPQFSYPRGVTSYIHNSSEVSTALLQQLKSIFLISHDPRFQVYLPSSSAMLISDPNDRLCTEHIEHLLRYFYPCKNYASIGLDKLLNPARLLQKYLVVDFVWRVIEEQMVFTILFPKQKEVKQVMNRFTACGTVSIYEVSQNQAQKDIFQGMVRYEGRMMNKWYSPQKSISHIFSIDQANTTGTIRLVSTLPYGFIYEGFTLQPQSQQIELTINQESDNKFFIFQLTIDPMVTQYVLQVYFRSSLPPFQAFQTIAGGGEQLMNIPIFQSNTTQYQLYSSIISQRLLQPDFSIPFQTITFTIGIVGYLWINLWRIHRLGCPSDSQQKIE